MNSSKLNANKSNLHYKIISSFVYLLIMACVISIFLPGYLHARKDKWQHKCKCALISLSKKQKKYATAHNDCFGSFEQLQKEGYIKQTLTPDKYINKYKILIYVKSLQDATVPTEEVQLSTFIIVATPFKSNWKLKTYAIDQEHVLVSWKGKNTDFSFENLNLRNSKLWLIEEVNCTDAEIR